MNPLLIKLREYKLSRPSLFCQDGWILASFLLFVFMDRDLVSVYRNAKKKKELSQNPAILTSRLVHSTDENISCRPIQIWQGKTVQKIYFRARNLSNV